MTFTRSTGLKPQAALLLLKPQAALLLLKPQAALLLATRRSVLLMSGVVALCLSAAVRGEGGAELFKLTASDAAAGDSFGFSVAVSGLAAIVGAYAAETDAGPNAGAAYLFNLTTGEETFRLTASDAAAGAHFGFSVAIGGNIAIVGSHSATTDAGPSAGAAYLFDVTTGRELGKITASDGAAADQFGFSVAVAGDLALVGARLDNHAGMNSGSAYLFDVSTGKELFKLTASDSRADDQFGFSVALSSDRAVVGARFHDAAGDNAGTVYVFDVATGQQVHKLIASDAEAGDQFGFSVAATESTVLIGAPLNNEAATNAGAAYLFDLTTGDEMLKLTAEDAAADDLFGVSVGLTPLVAVVGAQFAEAASGAAASSPAGENSGAAYFFNAPTGAALAAVTGSDTAAGDQFGRSVCIDQSTAIVGAFLHDTAGPGSGAAYLFDAGRLAIPGDINGDGAVNVDDLLILLAQWGPCPDPPAGPGANGDCPADLTGDGAVGVDDLLILLGNWTG